MTDSTLCCASDAPRPNTPTESVCSACPECDAGSARTQVAFHDLDEIPEEDGDGTRSDAESPCTCDDCQPRRNLSTIEENMPPTKSNNGSIAANATPNMADNAPERTVDVLVHDAPLEQPKFFQSVASQPYHIPTGTPPAPGFVLSPYQTPRFHTGGNVDDLLGDVQSSPSIQTFIQHNSVFMSRKVTQKQCCCQKKSNQPPVLQVNGQTETEPKCYVTEKNIELTYDYPRSTPIQTPTPTNDHQTTTTEVASTVVFVERRMPVRPKRFDFFFRSRSAPVGDNEEPIYATVNKLPKRLRRMELANLEKEVAYKASEPESSSRTEATLKTDSELSHLPHPDDDTSLSEKEKSLPKRPDSPKAKKRKRFSLTFKKRERKRREKKKDVSKNGVSKNGGPIQAESESERLIDVPEVPDMKHKHCTRHRPRNTMSSSSSGPRYKRDSYQEITTSHSEHATRSNSVCSSMNSIGSVCTHKSRKMSAPEHDGSIPWCGCWGAGCV